ncbi:MAG: RES family NAD+ phosphorylase [Bacteriovoracaceae bacterium]|nr:RES family NAD+ phosphorylase [Candidatus Brocadiales bacterium]MBL6992054.1 RES family NAD+ phosphorylase [Bacteriovoracaceae bacterium]
MSILDANNPELSFKTLKEVRAYSKFFLQHDPIESQCEFSTEEWSEFCERRQIQLEAQLDSFKNIDFSKANTTSIKASYYRIVPARYVNALSSEGSEYRSSRFNYKDVNYLKNRVIYFGKTQQCCEIEKFYLDYQIAQLKQMVHGTIDDMDVVFNHLEKQHVYEFNVQLDNVLVLTSKPSCDAINILMGTYQNEWFEINDEYDIPSSSQILGTLARNYGFSGIMYTSVRSQLQNNLVVFEKKTDPLSFSQISKKEFNPTLELFY